MISAICWNAKSINTKGALERLQQLQKMHNLSLIVILEPFADNSQLNHFKILLNMDRTTCNPNGKIWIFWTRDLEGKAIDIDDQHVTYEWTHVENPNTFSTSVIYGKCREHLTRPLWISCFNFLVMTFLGV